jgi:hypothetical protein
MLRGVRFTVHKQGLKLHQHVGIRNVSGAASWNASPEHGRNRLRFTAVRDERVVSTVNFLWAGTTTQFVRVPRPDHVIQHLSFPGESSLCLILMGLHENSPHCRGSCSVNLVLKGLGKTTKLEGDWYMNFA